MSVLLVCLCCWIICAVFLDLPASSHAAGPVNLCHRPLSLSVSWCCTVVSVSRACVPPRFFMCVYAAPTCCSDNSLSVAVFFGVCVYNSHSGPGSMSLSVYALSQSLGPYFWSLMFAFLCLSIRFFDKSMAHLAAIEVTVKVAKYD